MTMFASKERSPAEQRALLAEIISTFDAVERPTGSGMERARAYASRSLSERGRRPEGGGHHPRASVEKTPGSTPRSESVQLELT